MQFSGGIAKQHSEAEPCVHVLTSGPRDPRRGYAHARPERCPLTCAEGGRILQGLAARTLPEGTSDDGLELLATRGAIIFVRGTSVEEYRHLLQCDLDGERIIVDTLKERRIAAGLERNDLEIELGTVQREETRIRRRAAALEDAERKLHARGTLERIYRRIFHGESTAAAIDDLRERMARLSGHLPGPARASEIAGKIGIAMRREQELHEQLQASEKKIDELSKKIEEGNEFFPVANGSVAVLEKGRRLAEILPRYGAAEDGVEEALDRLALQEDQIEAELRKCFELIELDETLGLEEALLTEHVGIDRKSLHELRARIEGNLRARFTSCGKEVTKAAIWLAQSGAEACGNLIEDGVYISNEYFMEVEVLLDVALYTTMMPGKGSDERFIKVPPLVEGELGSVYERHAVPLAARMLAGPAEGRVERYKRCLQLIEEGPLHRIGGHDVGKHYAATILGLADDPVRAVKRFTEAYAWADGLPQWPEWAKGILGAFAAVYPIEPAEQFEAFEKARSLLASRGKTYTMGDVLLLGLAGMQRAFDQIVSEEAVRLADEVVRFQAELEQREEPIRPRELDQLREMYSRIDELFQAKKEHMFRNVPVGRLIMECYRDLSRVR